MKKYKNAIALLCSLCLLFSSIDIYAMTAEEKINIVNENEENEEIKETEEIIFEETENESEADTENPLKEPETENQPETTDIIERHKKETNEAMAEKNEIVYMNVSPELSYVDDSISEIHTNEINTSENTTASSGIIYEINNVVYDTANAIELSNEYATSYLFENESTLLVTHYQIQSGLSFSSPSVYPYYGYDFSNVIFTDDILEITPYAFQNNTNIKNIRFSQKMRWIWEYAFQGCINLENGLIFPDSLLQIEKYAFQGCKSIKGDIKLNISMRSHGNLEFDDDGDGNYITYLWDCWLGNYCFADCHIDGNLIVNGVTCLGSSAFENSIFTGNCNVLNDNSTINWTYYIPKKCFYNCSFGGTINLSSRLNNIQEAAFSYCTAQSLTFESNDTIEFRIQNEAFQYSNIKGQLILPENISLIGNMAFEKSAFEGTLYLPSLTSYGYASFVDCKNLTSVTFGDTFYLNQSMFMGCSGLTQELILPPSLKEIPYNLFRDCTGLYGNIIIPDNVTIIKSGAFSGCTGLNGKIITSNALIKIDYSAFEDCINLTELDLSKSVNLTEIEQSAFKNCENITSVINIPDSVKTIGNEAFYNCTKITGLNLSQNLTKIGDSAFANCTSLTGSIEFPSSLNGSKTSVGKYAFMNCSNLSGPVIFPEGFDSIQYMIFKNCKNLDGSLYIPSSVTTIGGYAFAGCENLDEISSKLYCSIDYYAFKDCTSLRGDIIFEKGQYNINIRECAFQNCKSLNGVLKLNGVTLIGYSAFENCGFTGNLIIPSSVAEIEGKAFYNCTNFSDTLIIEPDTEIYSMAFYNMTGITKINGLEETSYSDYDPEIFGLDEAKIKTTSEYLYKYTDYRDEFWSINRYPISVSFFSDDKFIAEQQVFYADEGKIKLPDAPEKSGYDFIGWYYENDSTENELTEDTEITKDLAASSSGDNYLLTAKAKYEIATYDVIFETGTDVQIEKQVLYYNEKAVEPTEKLIKEGHTFEGWYLIDEKYDFDTPVTSDITLIAKWNVNNYTVNFESNGGSEVEKQIIKYNNIVKEPVNPEKEGYAFKGWYLDFDLNNLYDFNTFVKSDLTLYAKWDINTYTVNFETNGGSYVPAQVVNYNEKAIKPENPTKDNYKFVNWYSDEDYLNEFDFNQPVKTDLTAYAKWLPKTKVYLDSNGGTCDVEYIEVYYSEKYGDLPIPVREHYTFLGWFTDKEEGTEITSESIKNTNNDETIYAHWEEYEYTIIFDANGGKGSMNNMNLNYSDTVTLCKNTFTKKGYTFLGWNTDKDTSIVKYKDEENISGLTSENKKEITLYAIWKQKPVTTNDTTNTDENISETIEISVADNQSNNAVPTITTQIIENVKTSDNSNIIKYSILLFLGIGLIVFSIVYKKKK